MKLLYYARKKTNKTPLEISQKRLSISHISRNYYSVKSIHLDISDNDQQMKKTISCTFALNQFK